MSGIGTHEYTTSHAFVGGLYFLAALVLGLVDVFFTTGAMSVWCTQNIVGGGYSYTSALWIGVGLFGLSYLVSAFWLNTPTQVNARYRPVRWIGHFFLMFAVFQILQHVIGLTDAWFIWLAPIVAALGLAYVQSSNDTMNTTADYSKVTGVAKTWWQESFPRFEGWVVGLFIVGAYWIVFATRASTLAGTAALWYPWLILSLYTVFHLIILIVTNYNPFDLRASTRETIYMIWEFIFILAIFLVVYIVFGGTC